MTNIKECSPDDPQYSVVPDEPLKPGYITKNFSIQELSYSQTAVRRIINNVPTGQTLKNLEEATKNLFQPLRDALGVPISISSGYRSPALNKAIGGSNTSAHTYGFAIDFRVHGVPNTYLLAKRILEICKENNLGFDQLILEFPSGDYNNPDNSMPGSWIHLGYKSPRGDQRKQILTAKKIKGRTTYLNGLV